MELNEGQAAVADAIFDFLLTKDKEFIISGPAGTGKTFLMKHVMSTIMKQYEEACVLMGIPQTIFGIELTATTNQATEVLQQSTGFPARTVHSFLNLKVTPDPRSTQSKIAKTPKWEVHRNTLIFIDEASMVDKTLYQYLHDGTDKNCKIIYIGDHCQMAPVFESVSRVYQSPKNFKKLTQPVRNAGQPALMALCAQLRETVETGVFNPIQEVPGVIDYLDDAGLKQVLDSQYVQEEVDSRVLCFTNSRVGEYNQYIRDLRGYPAEFTTGEIVLNNTATIISGRMMRVQQEFVVTGQTSNVYEHQPDWDDPSVRMDVYDIELAPRNNPHDSFKVKVPANKDHHQALMKYYGRNKKFGVYWELKNNFPDLRQKDAVTVYKAQGSTYNSVILDLTNIGKCTQPEQVARMLYVGGSRPRNHIYLYGQLPPRYRGA
jgi:exodeoxyribonuclease V